MRKLIISLMILSLFYSCTSINRFRGSAQAKRTRDAAQRNTNYITQTKPKYEITVLKHPDLIFPSTEPDSVVIYEGFEPLNDKYYVVGKMGIIEDTIKNYYRKTKEIKEKAAEIGGNAVIIVDSDTTTEEFGGDVVEGISLPGHFGTYHYWHKSPKTTVSTSYRIGLIIRWASDEKEIKQRINYIESEMDRHKENFIFADKQEAWRFLGRQYVDQKGMNVKPGERLLPVIIALLEDKEIKLDIEKAMMLSHHKYLDVLIAEVRKLYQSTYKGDGDIWSWLSKVLNEKAMSLEDPRYSELTAELKKLYPLALKWDFWNFLVEKDNHGNLRYSLPEAVELSHQVNYYKEEIAKLKKIYPLASGEKIWKIASEKDENANFKYNKEDRIMIPYIWKFIENKIAEFKKKCPLASEKEIWALLLEKDEEGKYILGIWEAVMISHHKNSIKKEK